MCEKLPVNEDLAFFSFGCDVHVVGNAYGIINGIRSATLSPQIPKALAEGSGLFEINGFTSIGNLAQIIRALEYYKVAEYSLATGVNLDNHLVITPPEKQEKPYIPAIDFTSQGLKVTFDPFFEKTPTRSKDDPVSYMSIEIDERLISYEQIENLPMSMIRKVTESLKSYIATEELDREEATKIKSAIYRFEKLLANEN